ncbi:uncharacterized protein LOC120341811 [Styela clava]|uniref:glutaredoxin-C3-like n=1 Tax=Styela clava TaxID=7725 RepID=UPI00193A499B|nr:glutaredoxin-C3-like [Styela clava]
MANASAKLIQSLIGSNKVAVFSKSYCPYCKLAKNVLNQAGASGKAVIELDERDDGHLIQNELTVLTGESTVPQVFINKEFVGGGTEVEKLHETGKLQKLLSNL